MARYLFLLIFSFALCNSNICLGTIFVPVSIKKQIKQSDAIVQGVVSDIVFEELDGQISTKVSLDLERWLGVGISSNQLDVYYPGGTIGENKLVIHGAPKLGQGESVVLFLKKHNEQLWINNLGLGKYSIKRAGKNNLIVNQIFPTHPEAGQMDLQKFADLSQWIKKENFKERFKDKYEINYEKHVQQHIGNQQRSIASVENIENHNQEDNSLPIYWLVVVFGVLGVGFRILRNRSI